MFWMPNGAKPAGMSGSVKPPSVVVCTYWPLLVLLAGAYTSTVPARKLVAKRKTPLTLTPVTRPLYTAPFAAFGTFELVTARTALSGGRGGLLFCSPPVQADIVPSSVAQMNDAARGGLVPGTRNAVATFVVGFHTMPVGAAFVGGGLGGQLDPCPTVAGGGQGIVTTRAWITPAPS